MAISFPASNDWPTPFGQTTGATTASKTYPAAVTPGSTLICIAGSVTNDSLSVADTVNGAWTAGESNYSAVFGNKLQWFYFVNTAAGTPTVTVTGTGSVARFIAICEAAGAATASVIDGTSTKNLNESGAGHTPAPGAITTTTAGAVIGFTLYYPAGGITAGSGYTEKFDDLPEPSFYSLGIESQITSAGSQNPDWSTKDYSMSFGFALKAAGGGGGSAIAAISSDYRMLGLRG